jgi:hypothetical protein
MYKVTIEKKDEINKYKKKIQKKKEKTKRRAYQCPPSPLSWNIYVKKQCRHTAIELDTIMCAN